MPTTVAHNHDFDLCCSKQQPAFGGVTITQARCRWSDVMLILLIVVLILLFGGGGGYYYGRGANWRGPHYGGGLLGLVLVILLVLWASGAIGPGGLR
jgi:hypothetical protein